jgi:hypothetical protein
LVTVQEHWACFYAGLTLTHAPLAGSPAIDAGCDAICAAPPVNGADQRGVYLPESAASDVAAHEYYDRREGGKT